MTMVGLGNYSLYNKYFRKETITYSDSLSGKSELYNKYFRKETITANVSLNL